MLHPDQFAANEAWIAFRLSDAPVRTESDGDFHFLALMDAASGFILCAEPVAVTAGEPSRDEAGGMLDQAREQKHHWPQTLLVATDLAADALTSVAAGHGITVVRVPEDQLLAFYGEARRGFRERFGAAAR